MEKEMNYEQTLLMKDSNENYYYLAFVHKPDDLYFEVYCKDIFSLPITDEYADYDMLSEWLDTLTLIESDTAGLFEKADALDSEITKEYVIFEEFPPIVLSTDTDEVKEIKNSICLCHKVYRNGYTPILL